MQATGMAAAMRLDERYREAIVRVVSETCGPQARVRLFGSRLDDALRGDDVDLLVELPCEADDAAALQRQLCVKLLRALDGRPVDVLVVGPQTRRQPVHERALREGLVASADAFLAARKLRNRLVHEYVEDRAELAANLGAAQAFVPQLGATLANVDQAIARLPLRAAS